MATSLFRDVFVKQKPVIAMVHVFGRPLRQEIDQACEDARQLERGGVDGLLVENYGYGYRNANQANDEAAERLTEVARAIWRDSGLPIGLNVLPNDYWKAFSVALSVTGMFIQMDHVVGDFVGCDPVDLDEFALMRNEYAGIAVLGGIHPKYYRLSDPDCSLFECAQKAVVRTDAVVVTGRFTGDAARLDDLRVAREAIGAHPLVVGSGLTAENAFLQLAMADGAIVGTAFKKKGVQSGEPVDGDLVKRLMDEVGKLR